jgi:hypothetical protein
MMETFVHRFRLTNQMTEANGKMCKRGSSMFSCELDKKLSVTPSVRSSKLKEVAAR